MKRDAVSRLLAGIVALALCGFLWTLWKGPSGQRQPERGEGSRTAIAVRRTVSPVLGREAGQPAAPGFAESAQPRFELPRVALSMLPTVPFSGYGEPYTDNVREPFQYFGPGREMDDGAPLDHVPIGLIAQLTGPAKAYGLAMQRGVDMAVGEANAAGGYEDKKFVVVPRDDLFDMGANANMMVKLIFEDRVRAIVGAVHSGNTHVGVRLALKCEVPQITSISTDPTITEVQIPWAFRCLADDRLQGRALAAFMFGRKDYRRLVLLNQQSKYGRMGIMEIRSLARRLGREVLLQMQFAGGQTDFGPIADRVARLAPDAVVVWGLYREAALLVKALRAKGLATPVLGGDGLVAPAFVEMAGAAAEGVVVTYPFDAGRDDARTREFLERYRKRYAGEADSFVAHAYDAASIVIASIRKAGLNRALIRDAMAATRGFPGVTGPISFDGTGNLQGRVELAVVKDGKFVKLGDGEGPP